MIKIGDTISHGGEEFTIVDIRHNQNTQGKVLYITAYDPDMAQESQQQQIKVDSMQKEMVDKIRNLMKEGGLGFGFGG